MHFAYQAARTFTKNAYSVRGVGLGRLCEAIRRLSARTARGKVILIDDFMGGSKFYCEIGEHMGSQIFWRGAYSSDQLILLERYLSSGATFIDIGANQGEFTVFASKLAGINGRVIALEPVSAIRNKLRRNVEANGARNVQILDYALSDREGSLPIYSQDTEYSDGTLHGGLGTLFKSYQRSAMIEMVQLKRLDDLVDGLGLDRVDVIKIDIEGGEFHALRGAEQTLRRWHPILLFECDHENCANAGYRPDELLAWLRGLSYEFFIIGHRGATTHFRDDKLAAAFNNILAIPAARQEKGTDSVTAGRVPGAA